MKIFKKLDFKKTLLTCFAVLGATVCSALGVSLLKPEATVAKAETLTSTVYQADGASVRVFKTTKDEAGNTAYVATDRQGIRFHIETGANYLIPNTDIPLLNTEETNENGSYKMAEGYKSYTLVIPTRLMGGSSDLTMDLANVLKIDTTKYWYTDKDGNWESVAYIYNIPSKWYTDEFTYKGIVVKVEGETETPVMWTSMEKRSLAWVAKRAYKDTIDESYHYWGSEEKDDLAAPLIKAFIPTYTINYKDGSPAEKVLWGDKIEGVDTANTYYDETNHEPIDVTKPLEMAESTTITLNSTEVSSFVFTGVEYTEQGFNVFATLPTEAFGNDVTLEPSAVDMVTNAGNVVKAKSVKVHVTGAGDDAVSQLQIGFDYKNISNGTRLTVKDTSHFYNEGILYYPEKDYEFTYNNNAWELPLGQITLADFGSIENDEETVDGVIEHKVRFTFKKDFLVNGGVEFKTADGQEAYITITCPENNNIVKKTISDGYYYWNQGQVSILEVPGSKGGNFWGEHHSDVMTIPAGTRVYQNNGYYLVSEEIRATYDGGGSWIFEPNYHTIDATEFTKAHTRQEGDKIYIDVITKTEWAKDTVEVICNEGDVIYNHTDNITKCEITNIFYHGEGEHQLLRLYIDEFSVTGDWVTIPKNIQFWVGNDVYTLTEDIVSYFVDTNEDGVWLTNPSLNKISKENIVSMHWEGSNIRYVTDETWSSVDNNRVIVDDTYIEGDGVVVKGSNYSNFFYYGKSNALLELQGLNFSETGGSVTVKAGVIFWLFSNYDFSFTGAYELTEDLAIAINGKAGSQISKDVELATLYKSDINRAEDNFDIDKVNGEIRLYLQSSVTGFITEEDSYCPIEVEGNANLDGVKSTIGQCYGPHKIVAILGFSGRGRPAGALFTLEAGTKLWLKNGEGYIAIAEDICYVWNGSAWVPYQECTVTFNSPNATVKVNGNAVTSVKLYPGKSLTFTVEENTGYFLKGVNNATKNPDGSYTVDVNGNMTITVQALPKIQLSNASIDAINLYDERSATYGQPDMMGVRIQLYDNSGITNLGNGYYGLAYNGSVTATVDGGVYSVSAFGFGYPINFFELRFDIDNLKHGDQFKIDKDTVFFSDTMPYAIEWTEDIVGTWYGSWTYSKQYMGELDWNTVGIEQIYSYSDFVDGAAINYTIRINLENALFGGNNCISGGGALGDITIDGTQYTGVCRYHGGGNKIFEISEWNYANGQVLVIKAGTKIIMGNAYYITTNTLTATCQANGSGAQWKFEIS